MSALLVTPPALNRRPPHHRAIVAPPTLSSPVRRKLRFPRPTGTKFGRRTTNAKVEKNVIVAALSKVVGLDVTVYQLQSVVQEPQRIGNVRKQVGGFMYPFGSPIIRKQDREAILYEEGLSSTVREIVGLDNVGMNHREWVGLGFSTPDCALEFWRASKSLQHNLPLRQTPSGQEDELLAAGAGQHTNNANVFWRVNRHAVKHCRRIIRV